MADLYETLGVDISADNDEIKRAYRRKAVETHPDKGGSDEAFGAVQTAYAVLKDAEKRSRYDETGHYDTGPDNSANAVHEMLRGHARKVIFENLNKLEAVDLAKLIRASIASQIHVAKDNIEAGKKDADDLREAARRFSKKSEGTNRIVEAINADIREIESKLQKAEAQLTAFEGAHASAKDYDYRNEAQPKQPSPLKEFTWYDSPFSAEFNTERKEP